MAPILITRSQINDQLWDDFIKHSQQHVVYGLSWYLDTVCDEWSALVWPSVDHYEIVMPLPIKKKWNLSVIQQPFFCQYLGIFSRFDLTVIQADFFLKALSAFSYISVYSFHPLNYPIINTLIRGYKQLLFNKNRTYWLPLSKSYDTIQNRYSTDRKLNLKRSGNSDLILEKSTNPNDLIDLFQKHHESGIRGGVNPKSYTLLYKLIDIMVAKQCAEIWYATLNGEKCAGALFVKSEEMAIYLFNSANETGRKSNVRTYFLDEFFKQHAENTIYFDFESPEIESIASFYESFGGETMPFFTIQKNTLPFPIRQIQQWRKALLLKTRQDPYAAPYKI